MSELNASEWTAFLRDYPHAHLLQSAEWGEFKANFGWEALRLREGTIGAQILFRRIPLGFSVAYIAKGPVGSGAAGSEFWDSVEAACRKRRAVFLKVERDGWYGDNKPDVPEGFNTSPAHIQPARTLVVDMRGSEDGIFNRMKRKIRYNIRLAAKKEVSVRRSDDLASFYRLLGATGDRKGFHAHSFDYYRRAYEIFHPCGMCELFIASYQGEDLAALMVFSNGTTASVLYGASSDRERNRKPTYPLQWEAIKWFRAQGCADYDMWGIPDEIQDISAAEDEENEDGPREGAPRDDGLWGVFQFKKGFGGTLKHAMPSMDRVYMPLLYRLYLLRYSGSSSP